MKKIIKGKMYDTDTARLVGEIGNGLSYRDFRWMEEHMYCKRTGEYFLHGEGGPASAYCEHMADGCRSNGEEIRPLTVSEARKWAEENLSADEYQDEFGEVAEDDSHTVLSISIRADVADVARRKAAEAGVSLSAYIESCIN